MRMGQWTIFNDPVLDGYFYAPEAPAMPVSSNVIPFAPKTAPAAPTPAAQGVMMFSEWLQKNMPEIHARVLQTMPEALIPEFAVAGLRFSGLADDAANPDAPSTDWGDKLLSLAQQLLPQYAQYQTQRQLLQINITRAEQGLPPLDVTAVAPQVRVGMTDDTKNLLIYGALGIGALFVLSQMRRR